MRNKPSPELMRALETLGKRPVQPPATPQEPTGREERCPSCDCRMTHSATCRASTPSPEGQTADELRRIAAHIRTPGNIWAEDAIDEIARLLENRARQLSPLPSPPTPEGNTP